MTSLIGIDVGGTNLRVGVVEDMKVVREQRIHADFSALCKAYPPQEAAHHIVAAIAQTIREVAGDQDMVAIGIGFPGFIDPLTGHVFQSPNLPGLADVDLAGSLAKVLGRMVVVENDALAAAYGEYRLAGFTGDVVYAGLGTGVGGGLIAGGKPVTGQHGFAMEIGHVIVVPDGRLCGCGNHGCLEQYASAPGLAKTFFELSSLTLPANDIAALANQGNVFALQAYDMAGAYLAQALALTLNIVDASQVVIGGGLSGAWPLMEHAFHARLQADLIPVLKSRVRVHISTSNDQAGMIGAALLAKSRVELSDNV